MFLRKYTEKWVLYGHSIVTEGVFGNQRSLTEGISAWWFMWVMTNCCFMSDLLCIIPTNCNFLTNKIHVVVFYSSHAPKYFRFNKPSAGRLFNKGKTSTILFSDVCTLYHLCTELCNTRNAGHKVYKCFIQLLAPEIWCPFTRGSWDLVLRTEATRGLSRDELFLLPWRCESSKCRLFHNATFFGSCIFHILYTGCIKFKRKFRGQRVKSRCWEFRRIWLRVTAQENHVAQTDQTVCSNWWCLWTTAGTSLDVLCTDPVSYYSMHSVSDNDHDLGPHT